MLTEKTVEEIKKALGRDSTSFYTLELSVNTESAVERLYGTPILPSTSDCVETDSAFPW